MSKEALLASQMKLYEEQPAPWESDYAAAMRCRDLEEVIAHGVYVFDRLSRFDEETQEDVFEGKLPFDTERDARIIALYEAWARVSRHHSETLAGLEKEGFEVEGSERFRQCYRDASGILTPDSEFFAGEKLVGIRDGAIDTHRAGETVAIRSISD